MGTLCRIAMAVTAGLITAAAFPLPGWGYLAWFALVPLLYACRGASLPMAALLGLTYGYVAEYFIYSWIFEIEGFGLPQAVVLGGYLALYPVIWCLAVSKLALRSHWLLFVAVPVLWVALEWLRSNAGLLAFPWATFAHSQAPHIPLIQLAATTGEVGISFLVVLVNTALYIMLAEKRLLPLATSSTVVALICLYGWWIISQAPARDTTGFRVAVVQPNISPHEPHTEEAKLARYQKLERITDGIGAADLIIWPETVVHDPVSDKKTKAWLGEYAPTLTTPLLFGASDTSKFRPPGVNLTIKKAPHNSAYLIVPGRQPAQPYRKRILVPFGEYTPFKDSFDWPQWLVSDNILELMPGNSATLFTLPDGIRIGVLICWENLFPELSREYAESGADLLVQLTNDARFGNTAAPWQHNQASVYRAVENRLPVIVAHNAGPSEVIDAYGRVQARLETPFTSGVIEQTISVSGSGTFRD